MGRPIAEPEVHLLPDGFVGHVVLRHGIAGAAPLDRDGDARVYRIPASGEVETETPANWGIREPAKMRFFYASSASSASSAGSAGSADDARPARRALAVHRPDAPVPDDEIAILGGYQVRGEFHYFVDAPRNAGAYKNPALLPGEREP
jgi:hypothetical protein